MGNCAGKVNENEPFKRGKRTDSKLSSYRLNIKYSL